MACTTELIAIQQALDRGRIVIRRSYLIDSRTGLPWYEEDRYEERFFLDFFAESKMILEPLIPTFRDSMWYYFRLKVGVIHSLPHAKDVIEQL